MQVQWVKIWSTTLSFRAEIAKGVLKENDIECVILNKQDSSYVVIGEIELFVPQDQVLRATNLIKEIINE